MSSDAATKAIAGLRASIGAGAWLTPNLAGRLFGLDPRNNPQLPYLGRLFGIRDVALAAGALTSQGDARRQWLQLGLACDVADTAAALLAGRRGYISPATTVLLTAPAVAATVMGFVALQPDGGSPTQPA
jgi:hypothetical protein